jgi:hypothetical protein
MCVGDACVDFFNTINTQYITCWFCGKFICTVYGVRKVNIDTDLRMASTGAVRKHLIENTANFDPRKFLKEATNAMSDICAARFGLFINQPLNFI